MAEFDRRQRPPRDSTFISEVRASVLDTMPLKGTYQFLDRLKFNGVRPQAPAAPLTLLPAAQRLVGRVGGDLTFDTSLLRTDEELSELGAALVHYAALTTYLYDDPFLFRSGLLKQHGKKLAEQLGLPTFRKALLPSRPKRRGEIPVLVRLSPIDVGSLDFSQKIVVIAAGLVAIAAQAPDAYENYKTLYEPAVVEVLEDYGQYGDAAWNVASDYIAEVRQRITDIIDADIVPEQQHRAPLLDAQIPGIQRPPGRRRIMIGDG